MTIQPRQAMLIVAVVVAALLAGTAILRGPLYPRYTADECLGAYDRASTRADTARIDLHPYVGGGGPPAAHRCGEVRARRATTLADLPYP